MHKNLCASLILPLLSACAIQGEADSATAERLCRQALGTHETDWVRLSQRPSQARELLRAAAAGPEGRISADVWFVDALNDVAICELRNRRFDFARVFEVRAVGGKWVLQRIHGVPPAIEIPELDEYIPVPPQPDGDRLGS
jgi:hypothetical protein